MSRALPVRTRPVPPQSPPSESFRKLLILLIRGLLLLLLLSRFSRVQLCATPWTAAYQAPPSMGFYRQEYWSGVPLPSLSSDGRQTENHNHRKLTNLITWTTALANSVKLWAMPCRATQMDGSWWRVLTKCGPLEKGMANHFNILALRTPWTVWKGKKIGHWKMNSPGW